MSRFIFTVENFVEKFSLDKIAGLIPGWIHLNSLDDFSIIYMSPAMKQEFGIKQDISRNKLERVYMDKFVHPETAQRILPLITEFIEKQNYTKMISFFQLIKTPTRDYQWYFTSLKLLKGEEYTIALTYPVTDIQDFNSQIETILSENLFFKSNILKYNTITNREKEIIQYLIKGASNINIAKGLNLSELTIKTHRQNIYRKLNINNICDLVKFAQIYGIR